MNKLYKIFLLLLVAGVVSYSCDGIEDSLIDDQLEENPLPTPTDYTSGSADFSNFIAIGNSLTAGFADGALYTAGQNNSIPAMLATQLGVAVDGGITFVQPAINSEDGFNTSLNSTDVPCENLPTVLGRFKLDISVRRPSPTIDGSCVTPYTGAAVDNFGVPGIVVGQLLTSATGNAANPLDPAFNPFYARFAANPGTSTIIGEAAAAQPTFFSLWIGNNDVLGYALGGASNPAILTSNGDFSTQFNAVINTMMTNTTADGVVANIPPILGLAYFRVVPTVAIPVTRESQRDSINAAYAQYNAGLDAAATGMAITQQEADRRKINFAVGVNAFVMEDETLTDLSGSGLPSIRQAEPTDLTVLSLSSVLGQDLGDGVYGVQDAVEDRHVLLPSEQLEIETSRGTFNGIIAAAVNANSDRLVLYDTNSPTGAFYDLFGLSDGVPGITVDGVDLTPDFTPTGVLSTDAIHPNPRGNALVVNGMLGVIEAGFGATLPRVNVLNQASVTLCVTGDCASEQ